MFKDIFKTQKLVSPYFQVRDYGVHILFTRVMLIELNICPCVWMVRSLQQSGVQICIAGAKFLFM